MCTHMCMCNVYLYVYVYVCLFTRVMTSTLARSAWEFSCERSWSIEYLFGIWGDSDVTISVISRDSDITWGDPESGGESSKARNQPFDIAHTYNNNTNNTTNVGASGTSSRRRCPCSPEARE